MWEKIAADVKLNITKMCDLLASVEQAASQEEAQETVDYLRQALPGIRIAVALLGKRMQTQGLCDDPALLAELGELRHLVGVFTVQLDEVVHKSSIGSAKRSLPGLAIVGSDTVVKRPSLRHLKLYPPRVQVVGRDQVAVG